MSLDAIRNCSKGSKSVIVESAKICNFLGHTNIRLEHFLLALLKYHQINNLALMRYSRLSTDSFISNVFHFLPPFNPSKSSLFKRELEIGEMGSDIPFSKTSARMIEVALKEAEIAGSELIGPEHIFLATLYCARGELRKFLKKSIPVERQRKTEGQRKGGRQN